MTKRLVDIDDQLLERAKAVSGETTIKGTVEAALKKLANDELIMEYLAYLKDPANATDPKLIDEAKAPKLLDLLEDDDDDE